MHMSGLFLRYYMPVYEELYDRLEVAVSIAVLAIPAKSARPTRSQVVAWDIRQRWLPGRHGCL